MPTKLDKWLTDAERELDLHGGMRTGRQHEALEIIRKQRDAIAALKEAASLLYDRTQVHSDDTTYADLEKSDKAEVLRAQADRILDSILE